MRRLIGLRLYDLSVFRLLGIDNERNTTIQQGKWQPEYIRVKLNNSVYILASKRNGTLYIGVTSDLVKRIWEHKQNFAEGFTSRYGVHVLVYFEMHDDIAEAIRREKQLKKWK
jgi:putative endonuclease